MVARLLLSTGGVAQGLWKGDQAVLSLVPARPLDRPDETEAPGPQAALDVGSGCEDRQALWSSLEGDTGAPLLPRSTEPTTAVGWLDGARVLVAAGGCDGSFDLWVAEPNGRSPVLLVKDVERGAVRVPDISPPPPLPDIGVRSDFA